MRTGVCDVCGMIGDVIILPTGQYCDKDLKCICQPENHPPMSVCERCDYQESCPAQDTGRE